jgi:hypothetical protein
VKVSVGAGPSVEADEGVSVGCVRLSVGAGPAEVAGAGGGSVDESVDGGLLSVAVGVSVSLVEEEPVVAGEGVPVWEGEFEGATVSAVPVPVTVVESRPVASGDTPVEDGTGLEST